jgi:HEAT repeat protein
MDKSPALRSAFAAAEVSDWSQVRHCLADLAEADRPTADLLALSLLALEDDDLASARSIAGLLNFELAVPDLLALLNEADTNPEQQWFCLQLLGECPPALAVAELASYLETAPDAEMVERSVQALVKFGAEAIDQLKILLTIPAHKMSAISALASIRHSQTIEPLLAVAMDPDPVARLIAVEALSSFHDQRIPPLLLERLTDPHGPIRQAAVVGLGMRSDLAISMGLVAHLEPLLRDPELPVAIAAATALGRMDRDDAVAALTSFQPEWPGELGLQILRSLGWLNRSRSVGSAESAVIDGLEKVLATRPLEPAAIEAIRALGQQQAHPDRASTVLMDHYARIPAVLGVRSKQEIATALGNLQSSKLVEHLVQLLGDPDAPVRWQAIYCLQQGGLAVRSRLQELAMDSNHSPELQASLEECLKNWPISNG